MGELFGLAAIGYWVIHHDQMDGDWGHQSLHYLLRTRALHLGPMLFHVYHPVHKATRPRPSSLIW
jgi:hypothetical protein